MPSFSFLTLSLSPFHTHRGTHTHTCEHTHIEVFTSFHSLYKELQEPPPPPPLRLLLLLFQEQPMMEKSLKPYQTCLNLFALTLWKIDGEFPTIWNLSIKHIGEQSFRCVCSVSKVHILPHFRQVDYFAIDDDDDDDDYNGCGGANREHAGKMEGKTNQPSSDDVFLSLSLSRPLRRIITYIYMCVCMCTFCAGPPPPPLRLLLLRFVQEREFFCLSLSHLSIHNVYYSVWCYLVCRMKFDKDFGGF